MIFKESFRDIKENNVGMDPSVNSIYGVIFQSIIFIPISVELHEGPVQYELKIVQKKET